MLELNLVIVLKIIKLNLVKNEVASLKSYIIKHYVSIDIALHLLVKNEVMVNRTQQFYQMPRRYVSLLMIFKSYLLKLLIILV